MLPKSSRFPSLGRHRHGDLADNLRHRTSNHWSVQEPSSFDHALPVHPRFGREHLGDVQGTPQTQWLPSSTMLASVVESLGKGRKKLSIGVADEIAPVFPEGPPIAQVLRSERPPVAKDVGPKLLETVLETPQLRSGPYRRVAHLEQQHGGRLSRFNRGRRLRPLPSATLGSEPQRVEADPFLVRHRSAHSHVAELLDHALELLPPRERFPMQQFRDHLVADRVGQIVSFPDETTDSACAWHCGIHVEVVHGGYEFP
ncbi:hypothetical protein [Streptomyces sp. NPDC127039]|uniref:hypothetical protein n=1 Tax=Streptomyces sp. NPDC127039 TaxID=3347115 RepID=UPI00365815A7